MCLAEGCAHAPHGAGRSPPPAAADARFAGLDGIVRAGVGIAIVPRSLDPSALAALPALLPAGSAPIRLDGSPLAVRDALRERLGGGAAAEWLAEDAGRLAGVLARLARCDRVALRFEAVAGDACRLFHTDHVALRLATTYVGRGTQWLTAEVAASLPKGGTPPDGAIRTMPTGAVAVFKGSRWDGPSSPLVHRSPPRRPGDPVRLFLSIDPAAP